jgi:hypothetical protein
MRNRAFLKVALLGLLALALVPGLAAAGQEMLASQAAERATAVSGPVISISPLSHDFGLVLAGSSASFDYTVSNTGDAALNISSASVNDAALSASFGSMVVPAGGSTLMTVMYAPTSGAALLGMVTVHSDATNGDATVNATGRGNTAPSLTFNPAGSPPDHSYTGAAFTTFTFDVTANDAEGDDVTLSASGLPPGATFDGVTGHFSWDLLVSDAGPHDLTICGSDGSAGTCEDVHILVTAVNNPPIADPGGPYLAGTNQPIQFDGSGSSDPDGNALTYAWIFGDGETGSGVSTSHSYDTAGEYLVSLSVTDNGIPPLTGTGLTNATVVNTIPFELIFKGSNRAGERVRAYGSGLQQVGLENALQNVLDIDPSSLKMTANTGCSASQISVNLKGSQVGDLDNDGVPDLDVAFSRIDLAALLGCVQNNSMVEVTVSGFTTAAAGHIPVQGVATIKVGTHGGGAAVRAFASPNPFNPETSINYSLRNSGNVSIRIYSLQGRLIRTLFEGYSPGGENEVRWNGRDNNGSTVSSGLYFVKVQQGADSGIFKVMVTK